jgi:hypothetical protein
MIERGMGRMRRGCMRCLRLRRIAIWSGRRKGLRGSAGFWAGLSAGDGLRRWRSAAKGQVYTGQSAVSLNLLRKLHQTIAKITLDFNGRWHFNTCIAAIMIELVNELVANGGALDSGRFRLPWLLNFRSLVLLLGAVCAVSLRRSCGRNGWRG